MPITAILEIIRLSLEITLETMKGIPLESRQAAWERHEKRIEFWANLMHRFDKDQKPDEGKSAVDRFLSERDEKPQPTPDLVMMKRGELKING